jgi:hypothetical protein
MELQYVKELEKYNLQVKSLPEDARTGIKEINKALSFIKMAEAKGKKTSPDAIKKIKAMDKWVCYEIYDMVEDTDENEDEIPYESDDVEDDLEEQDDLEKDEQPENIKKVVKTNADGNKINSELIELGKSGKNEYTIAEIKTFAPTTYKAIFDVYEKGEQNGVQTQAYSLIEFEEQKYKLKKI